MTEKWSVWIEGGGNPGRWMSDYNTNTPIWSGTFYDASLAAADRNYVHGIHGLTYTVDKTPEGPPKVILEEVVPQEGTIHLVRREPPK